MTPYIVKGPGDDNFRVYKQLPGRDGLWEVFFVLRLSSAELAANIADNLRRRLGLVEAEVVPAIAECFPKGLRLLQRDPASYLVRHGGKGPGDAICVPVACRDDGQVVLLGGIKSVRELPLGMWQHIRDLQAGDPEF